MAAPENRSDRGEADQHTWWGRLVCWPISHPRTTLGLALVLCLLAVLRVTQLRPDASIDTMFPENSPASTALLRVMNGFAAAEEMLILSSLPPEVPNPPDTRALVEFAHRLEKTIAASPEASKLCGGVSYQVDAQMRQFFEKELVPGGMFYLTETQVERARQRLTPEGMQAQIAQNEALIATPGPAAATIAKLTLKDPLRLHEFVMDRLMGARPFQTYGNAEAFLSPDGRSLLIRVRGLHPVSNMDYAKALNAAVREAAAGANTGGLTLDFAGSYPIAAAAEKAIRADMIASITGSVLFLQILFVVAYRRPGRLFALAFAPVAIGVLFGFAANALTTATITPMTAVIGAILAGLAIDYSVYVISDYETHRRAGHPPRDAARQTVLAVTPALFAAWLTTAMGFAAIGCSSVPGIREFARIGGLGLSGAFASSLLLLPVALALFDRRSVAQAQAKPEMRLSTLPLLLWIARHRKGCVGGSVAVLVAMALVLAVSKEGILPLERDLTAMHPQPNEPLAAQAKIAQRFGTSPDALLLHVQAQTPQQLVTRSHAARERLLSAELRNSGGITGSFGLADLLPDPAQVPHRLEELQKINAEQVAADFRRTIEASSFDPATYEPYAQFLQTLLNRRQAPELADLMRYPSLARNLLPADVIEAGRPPTEAIMLVFTATPLDRQEQRQAAVTAVRKALGDVSGVTLTGISVVAYDTEATIHRDLPRLIGLAAALVGVYLLVHFRSLTAALLATLPMLTSILVLLAVARLADQRLNLVNLIAAPLLIGMDVDYGIFLVTLANSRKGFTPRTLAQRIDSGCYAVMICVASGLLGFGTLYFTSVPAVQSLGFAVGVGLLASLGFTLFLRLPLIFASLPEQTGRGETTRTRRATKGRAGQ